MIPDYLPLHCQSSIYYDIQSIIDGFRFSHNSPNHGPVFNLLDNHTSVVSGNHVYLLSDNWNQLLELAKLLEDLAKEYGAVETSVS